MAGSPRAVFSDAALRAWSIQRCPFPCLRRSGRLGPLCLHPSCVCVCAEILLSPDNEHPSTSAVPLLNDSGRGFIEATLFYLRRTAVHLEAALNQEMTHAQEAMFFLTDIEHLKDNLLHATERIDALLDSNAIDAIDAHAGMEADAPPGSPAQPHLPEPPVSPPTAARGHAYAFPPPTSPDVVLLVD